MNGWGGAQFPAVEVIGLKVCYGENVVFNGVSFTVARGVVCAIVGPNGSGKSTLLMSICGLMKMAGGHVRCYGKDVKKMRGRERARLVSILPQGLPSFIPFTVYETVLMGRYPLSTPVFFENKEDVKKVEELLMRMDLWEMRSRRASELSGGELQRVMLASVFAQDTSIVLLDEPTAAMDLTQKKKLMEMILKMAEGEEKTIIIATHDLNLVNGMCDYAGVIEGGDRIIYGRVEDVLTVERIKKSFGVQIRAVEDGGRRYFLV